MREGKNGEVMGRIGVGWVVRRGRGDGSISAKKDDFLPKALAGFCGQNLSASSCHSLKALF